MSKKYLVGSSENAWDFESAYRDAEDGDVMIFESDYSYSPDSDNYFEIGKNLELIGKIEENEDAIHFSNTIFSKIVISEGVRVKFSNLYFQIDELGNNLYVQNGSEVELNCVTIENLSQSNDYPCIYVESGSQLHADALWINASSDTFIKFDNATATIKNSNLSTEIMVESNSELELENVNLEKIGANAIHSNASTITLRNCNITGGSSEENVPALFIKNSDLYIYHSSIFQENFPSCVYMIENSYLFLENSELTSLDMFNSRGVINGSVIKENLFLREISYIVGMGAIEFMGENSEMSEIYLDDQSSLNCDEIVFSQESNRIVRLLEASHLKAQKIIGEKIQYQVSEDSSLVEYEYLSQKISVENENKRVYATES